MPLSTILLLYQSGWPKFAYVANPIPPETRCVTYKLHSQRRSCFHFSILPVLYTQDTFTLFSNFEVDYFARHLFFLSFILSLWLWKEFNSHGFVVTFHFPHSLGSPPVFYPAVDDCWICVNVSCSACIYSRLFVVSLNDESQLTHRRQQSASSAFQFHYTWFAPLIVTLSLKFCKEIHWHHFIHYLPRLHPTNINRSNERRWFHILKKGKKQKMSCRNNYWCRLHII